MSDQRQDGATYKVRGDDVGGWEWHLSRPGYAGECSDVFATEQECVADVLAEFPGAIRSR